MEIEYTEIEDLFAELNGRPRTWWPLVEDEAFALLTEMESMEELRFE